MTISGENDRNALPSDLFISHNLLHERWKTSSLKATNSGYYQEGWIAGSSLVKPQNEAYLSDPMRAVFSKRAIDGSTRDSQEKLTTPHL
jgi:hypothetical protein